MLKNGEMSILQRKNANKKFSAAKLRQDKNYNVRRLSGWYFPALKPESCNFYMGNFTCFESFIYILSSEIVTDSPFSLAISS